ncbi:MAG: CDP-4-keto-6-deoxy-D-glucose-3-dehydrase [Halolamina sp.]|uniref:MinD/ParA family ATP-binding protein n=1 Tax=Halolamina sp. TaxID=1940283 RepID=UPI002FC35322
MLAIAGGKGGVGKTTTALGLAAALPGKPLVVDADRDMPDLHALAGVNPEPGLDAAVRDQSGHGQPCPQHDCRVLPAPRGDAPRTDRLLNRLAAKHGGDDGTEEPILVDTPAGVSVDAAAPLQAVDAVLLVSTACAPALRDAAKTASMARAVGTPVIGVLLTRAVVRPPGAGDLLDCSVVGCIPSEPTQPLESHRVQERYSAIANRLREAAPAEIGCEN